LGAMPETYPYWHARLEHGTDDEIIALLGSVDLAAEPIPADPRDRARELVFLSHALSDVQRRGDTRLAIQLEARVRALELHPDGLPPARRPSIATRVETFLRQESKQRGTSWMVFVTLLVLLFAALVIYGPELR
jgi:hypothetical protein